MKTRLNLIGTTCAAMLSLALTVSAQGPRGAGGPPPGQGGPEGMGPPPDGGNMAVNLLAEFDLNEDGGLDEAELAEALDALPMPPRVIEASEWITAYDLDGTESLSAEELETGLKDNRPEMPRGGPPGEPPADQQ